MKLLCGKKLSTDCCEKSHSVM